MSNSSTLLSTVLRKIELTWLVVVLGQALTASSISLVLVRPDPINALHTALLRGCISQMTDLNQASSRSWEFTSLPPPRPTPRWK